MLKDMLINNLSEIIGLVRDRSWYKLIQDALEVSWMYYATKMLIENRFSFDNQFSYVFSGLYTAYTLLTFNRISEKVTGYSLGNKVKNALRNIYIWAGPLTLYKAFNTSASELSENQVYSMCLYFYKVRIIDIIVLVFCAIILGVILITTGVFATIVFNSDQPIEKFIELIVKFVKVDVDLKVLQDKDPEPDTSEGGFIKRSISTKTGKIYLYTKTDDSCSLVYIKAPVIDTVSVSPLSLNTLEEVSEPDTSDDEEGEVDY